MDSITPESRSTPHAQHVSPITTNSHNTASNSPPVTTSPPAATTAPAAPGPQGQTLPAPPVRERYALHKARLVFRIIALVSAFIALFLWAAMYAKRVAGSAFSSLSIFFLIIPIVWNIAEFITLAINKQGIHPGAHIALDCIIAIILIPASFGFIYGSTRSRYYAYDGDCPTDSICRDQYGRIYRSQPNQPILAAAGAFVSIAALCHIVLFVMACVAVHKWRMRMRERRAAMGSMAYGAPFQWTGNANVDPNMAYLVTMPNGQQYVMPPGGGAPQPVQQPGVGQANQGIPQGGFYAPPRENTHEMHTTEKQV